MFFRRKKEMFWLMIILIPYFYFSFLKFTPNVFADNKEDSECRKTADFLENCKNILSPSCEKKIQDWARQCAIEFNEAILRKDFSRAAAMIDEKVLKKRGAFFLSVKSLVKDLSETFNDSRCRKDFQKGVPVFNYPASEWPLKQKPKAIAITLDSRKCYCSLLYYLIIEGPTKGKFMEIICLEGESDL